MITAARPAAGSTIQRFNFIRELSFLGVDDPSIVADAYEKRVRGGQEVHETFDRDELAVTLSVTV
jgi:hypothetical protein